MNALSWIFHLTAEQLALIGVAVSGTYFSLNKSGIITKLIESIFCKKREEDTTESHKIYMEGREKILDENKELKEKLEIMSKNQKTLQLRISLLESVIESQKCRIQEITGLLVHEQLLRNSSNLPEPQQKD
nr:MAG TPA: hypothetical protein [Caudoviricetes sp.]